MKIHYSVRQSKNNWVVADTIEYIHMYILDQHQQLNRYSHISMSACMSHFHFLIFSISTGSPANEFAAL